MDTLFPYTTLFRSLSSRSGRGGAQARRPGRRLRLSADRTPRPGRARRRRCESLRQTGEERYAGPAPNPAAGAGRRRAAQESRRKPGERPERTARPVMGTGRFYRKAEAVEGEGGCYTVARSEEHTSELQSLMRISYAVLCLKKK